MGNVYFASKDIESTNSVDVLLFLFLTVSGKLVFVVSNVFQDIGFLKMVNASF